MPAPRLAAFAHDLRFTLRQLTKARGFALVAVLTLALGIGANTAIFTVVHALLISPEPYPDGNSIVRLERMFGGGKIPFSSGKGMYDAWHARAHSLDAFGAAFEQTFQVPESGANDSVPGARVTPGFLRRTLQVHPVIGREFDSTDALPNAAPVAMIGSALWHRAYGGRAGVLGKLVHVDGKAYTIVGVAPPDLVIPMTFDPPRDLLLPYAVSDTGAVYFEAYARLRPGVTIAAASHEMDAIMHAPPDTGDDQHAVARAMRAQDYIGERQTQTIQVLFAAVGALLLIACTNVANLLLARGWGRRREFALRLALGAGRGRLVWQVLAESVVLALVGGALGVLLARLGLHVIIAVRPDTMDQLSAVRLDSAVLLWSIAISVASGLAFGAMPALFAAGRSPGEVLSAGSRTSSGGAGARRMRATFIVIEVALSLVMLVGAGLLVRSFVGLVRTPLGFDPAGIIYPVVLPKQGVDPRTAYAQEAQLAAAMASAPGVVAAMRGDFPAMGMIFASDFQTEGAAGPVATDVHRARTMVAGPGYFRFLEMRLLAGRGFDSTDATPAVQTAVINEALARRLWPGQSPLGLQFRPSDKRPWLTVVGVAADVHMPGLTGDAEELQLYLARNPITGGPTGGLLLRTHDATATVAALERMVPQVAPSVRVVRIYRAHDFVSVGLQQPRFAMALIGAFALVALLLTAVGLYGVIAYAVTHRTREIGIRVALGAEPGSVSRLVVGEGLKLTAIGLALGLVGAAFATRALTSILYGVNPLDPATFAAIAALLVATTLIAAYLPARRALRIDPTEALRAE